jgi:hypothetical protein
VRHANSQLPICQLPTPRAKVLGAYELSKGGAAFTPRRLGSWDLGVGCWQRSLDWELEIWELAVNR